MRFIGLPRASWAARTMQSSCGGRPHRCQRSHSPQLKSRLRRRRAGDVQLVNIRRRMLSVRIILLPAFSIGVQLPKYAPPQPAALIRINLGFGPTPAAQVCYEEL